MDDLTTLLREAVEHVEPTDRRAELRELVAVSSRRRHRRYAVAGGLLAAAVVVTGVTVAAQQPDDPDTDPAGTKHAVDRSRDYRPAYALYYLGLTPQGPRLFREFRTGPGPETTPASALRLLESPPDDPDYWTPWPSGSFADAQVVGEVIEVDVGDLAGVGQRPDGMSEAEAELSVEQVVYTVQAAIQEQLPVQFTHDGSPIARVRGVPTSEPLVRGEQLDVLALASIADPRERRVVEDSFSANGQASSFEGTVPWRLEAPDGTVVRSGSAQTYGYTDRLYPWATGQIDVADLDPGEYTFVVTTADQSDDEGPGPMVDTRTVIIK